MILTVREVAKLCGVDDTTVRRWAKLGELPYFELPTQGGNKHRVKRFKKDDVDAFIQKNRVTRGHQSTSLENDI